MSSSSSSSSSRRRRRSNRGGGGGGGEKSVFKFVISKNKINNFRPWNGWVPAQKLGLAVPFPIFFVVSGWKFAGWFPTPGPTDP